MIFISPNQKAVGSTPTWRVQFFASFFKEGLPVTPRSKIIQYIAESFFYYLVLLKKLYKYIIIKNI
jgi:hypothetical protein